MDAPGDEQVIVIRLFHLVGRHRAERHQNVRAEYLQRDTDERPALNEGVPRVRDRHMVPDAHT